MAVYTTIDNPELYFQCKKWAGNNSGSGQAITLDGDEDMQPDLVWVKSTDNTHAHVVYDSVRTSPAKYLLQTNTNIAERTATIGSFDSDGVTFSNNDGFYNGSDNYVGWFWKESATAGFDIVSYTGNSSDGTTTQDISHSLSAVPHFIIIKNRADSTNWAVYHKSNTSAPETEIIYLNSTNATADDNAFFGDTDPTSSQFRVGGDNGVNGNSDAMIAYLWSEKQGYSKFGSFEGNANAAGPFVYCGFRPAWVMIKDIDNSGNSWLISDNKRNTFNVADDRLFADLNNVENQPSDSGGIDFVSNGFKVRTNDGSTNASGTRIFMAFAEAPFVNSNGVPCNAR